jgi:hypothetical protein
MSPSPHRRPAFWAFLIPLCVVLVLGAAAAAFTGNGPVSGPSGASGDRVVVAVDPDAEQSAVEQTAAVLASRVAGAFEGSNGSVAATERTVVLTGPEGSGRTLAALARQGTLRFRPVLEVEASPGGRPCTRRIDRRPEAEVVLEQCDAANQMTAAAMLLGPTEVTEARVTDLQATTDPNGATRLVVRFDPQGVERYNTMARGCIDRDETCPTGALAIALDGVVLAAPSIERADVGGGGVNLMWAFGPGELDAVLATLDTEPLAAAVRISAPTAVSPVGGGLGAGFAGLGVALVASALLALLRHRKAGLAALAATAIGMLGGWVALSVLGLLGRAVVGTGVLGVAAVATSAVMAASWWALERLRAGHQRNDVYAGALTVAVSAALGGTAVGLIGAAMPLPSGWRSVTAVVWGSALVVAVSAAVAGATAVALAAPDVKRSGGPRRAVALVVSLACLATAGAGIVAASQLDAGGAIVHVASAPLEPGGDQDEAPLETVGSALEGVEGASVNQVNNALVVTTAEPAGSAVLSVLAETAGVSEDDLDAAVAVPVDPAWGGVWVAIAAAMGLLAAAIGLSLAHGPALSGAVSAVSAAVAAALGIGSGFAGAGALVACGVGLAAWSVTLALGSGMAHARLRRLQRDSVTEAILPADVGEPAQTAGGDVPGDVDNAVPVHNRRRSLTRRQRDARGDSGAVV